MPKVISRSTISTSNDSSSTPTQTLRVYYCVCGDFALVCDRSLEDLPIRPIDGSYVLRNIDGTGTNKKKRTYKITAKQGKSILFKREDMSMEKQYHFHCSRCDLPIGYEVTPPPLKSGPFTFLFPGALTETQGQAPANVLLDAQT
ncbi:unnamed protein product [Sympodiomycopsis kandeliae]